MTTHGFDDAQLNEVRQVFLDAGISVAEWARSHNFPQALVYAVLKGRNHATRGKSHLIAVALGLKKQSSNRLRCQTAETKRPPRSDQSLATNFGKEFPNE